uniref:Ubiquitin-like protease family profile domain-containing protein n=1 Tax=Brassica oleracea var. oleracea TaxID=109376 RepID=A0A0D3D5G2_BRAOL
MLGFQLDIKKKYELWSLVGPEPVRFSLLEFEHLTGLNCEYIEDLERPHCVVTKELTSFWEMLGVHVEAGPYTQEIIAAFARCEGWSRDDRKRLAYPLPSSLDILKAEMMELEQFENYPWGRAAFKVLMDFVKDIDISGCYTVNGFAQALQVWVYTALPELGANYGNPLPNNPSPPILAYKGRKGCRQFKEAIVSQTRVINFVQKEIGEMFPKWEFDVEDTPAENKIKLLFVKKPWKWTMDCWEVTEDLPDDLPHIEAWINVLRKRYDANPQHFRRERMCFLYHLFAQQRRFNYKDFKDSEPDQNGLGRRLPGGAWNYYAGTIPSFCQSNKVCGMDIDDVYAPVNYNDTHWIATWISIPKRHIVVWGSICSSISPEELDVVMEPFLYMLSYLLVECASSDEQRAQYSLEPFTYERSTNLPPARVGDCGVYSLKYIECHALGIEFSKRDIAKPNGKTMRDKMAVDIFQELPDAHEFENKDNDANLGTYEG